MNDSQTTDFFSSLLIVLVIYEMRIEESPSYQSLTAALSLQKASVSLFIYDNSPRPQKLAIGQGWNTIYCHNPSNAGVSKAYNEGFERAKELNKKWLLLTDQDTDFPENSFESYSRCVTEFKPDILVPILEDRGGIVSPFKFRFGGGVRLKDVKRLVPLGLTDYCVVNSGLLISLSAFEKAGGYDENLTLDFSDIAFVHRLRKKIDNFIVADIVCRHELSASDNVSVDDRLKRFQMYVQSSRYFIRSYSASKWMQYRILLQALRLSIRYLNFNFMLPFFKQV